MTTGHDETPVIVVGAGPVGMATALALHARNVRSIVLEREPADRARPGSRADYVHGATLEILEAIQPGLGTRIADAGLVCPTTRTCWRGRELYSRTFSTEGDQGALPHHARISQQAVEAMMQETLEELGIPIHWDTSVETVEAHDNGVEVQTSDGEQWDAPFVIGADGGSSTVRHEIGVAMSGTESENTFLIVDVERPEPDPRPIELTYHYRHPDLDDRNVLIAPFAGGWRIDLACRTADDPAEMTGEPFVDSLITATLGEQYAERVSWVSTYRFKQVTAQHLCDSQRRVLLTGDAAHLFAPFGGRGMNSGIHDADAAASAIASAVAASTDTIARREVENYARLRKEAADWNTYAAGEALAHIQADGLLADLKQRAAAEMARWWDRPAVWLHRAPFGPHAGPPIPTIGKF